MRTVICPLALQADALSHPKLTTCLTCSSSGQTGPQFDLKTKTWQIWGCYILFRCNIREAPTCLVWRWAGEHSCLQPCDTPLLPELESAPSLGHFYHHHHLFPVRTMRLCVVLRSDPEAGWKLDQIRQSALHVPIHL